MVASKVLSVLILVWASVATAAPTAASWKLAFPAAALSRHLPGTDLDVLVSSSGEGAVAAEALREVLGGLSGVRRVVVVSPPASIRDDAARLAWTQRRAAAEAIFYVSLERDGTRGASAVVAIYDPSGRQSGTLVASPDAPLVVQAGAAPASGLSRSALSSVDAALASPDGVQGGVVGGVVGHQVDDDQPQRVVIPTDAHGRPDVESAYALTPDPQHPARGFRQPLYGEQLYQALGRNDLAEAYIGRRHTRTALVASGASIIAIGALSGLCVLAAGGVDAMTEEKAHGHRLEAAGGITLGVTIGVGAALIVAGKEMTLRPVSAERVVRLAEKQRATLTAENDE